MALNPTYSVGTATVSAGSAIVTVTGAQLLAGGVREGDVFEREGLSITIASVDSASQITLVKPWPGASGAGPYETRYIGDAVRVMGAARQAINEFAEVAPRVTRAELSAVPFETPLEAALAAPSLPSGVRRVSAISSAGILGYRRDPAGPELGGGWTLTDGVSRQTITVRVPSQFPTIQAALDEYAVIRTVGAAKVRILIESGHVLTYGFGLRGGDYSHIEIASEDAIVLCSPGFVGTDASAWPGESTGLMTCIDAVAPVWNTHFDMSELPHVEGYMLLRSRGYVRSGKGVTNSRRNLICRESQLMAPSTNWSGAQLGCAEVTSLSTAELRNSKFNESDRNNPNIISSAFRNASLNVSRGTVCHIQDAEFFDCGASAVSVRRSFCAAIGINVQRLNATGLVPDALAIHRIDGGHVVANGATLDGAVIPLNRMTGRPCVPDEAGITYYSGGSFFGLGNFNVPALANASTPVTENQFWSGPGNTNPSNYPAGSAQFYPVMDLWRQGGNGARLMFATNRMWVRYFEAGVQGSTQEVQFAQGGTTAARPTNRPLYWCYFDTTLGRPIWWRGGSQGWVDATGTSV